MMLLVFTCLVLPEVVDAEAVKTTLVACKDSYTILKLTDTDTQSFAAPIKETSPCLKLPTEGVNVTLDEPESEFKIYGNNSESAIQSIEFKQTSDQATLALSTEKDEAQKNMPSCEKLVGICRLMCLYQM